MINDWWIKADECMFLYFTLIVSKGWPTKVAVIPPHPPAMKFWNNHEQNHFSWWFSTLTSIILMFLQKSLTMSWPVATSSLNISQYRRLLEKLSNLSKWIISIIWKVLRVTQLFLIFQILITFLQICIMLQMWDNCFYFLLFHSKISKQYFCSSSSVVSIFCSEILELNQTQASVDTLMGQCHDTTILDQMKNKTRSYLMYRHVSMCEYCTYDAAIFKKIFFSSSHELDKGRHSHIK